MKQTNKEQLPEVSHKIENTKGVSHEAIELRDSLNKMVDKLIDQPTEYFLPSQIEFKFCWADAMNGNFAENLIQELNNKED